MHYSFKKTESRDASNALKYRLKEELFGRDDILPLWVADMDIETPDFILNAIKKRLQHPFFGYEKIPKELFMAQIMWMKKRHGVIYKVEDFFYSPSVVTSMHIAIEAFSEKGDGVVVQTPVYPPFFDTVKKLERKVVVNPLKLNRDGKYNFDLNDLKSKIDKRTKLLLLCSPHNPVGRVWTREELYEIVEVCKKHNIIIFSDEIHCDLVYKPYKYIPLYSLSNEAAAITLSAIGPGKTFNMAGFAMSSLVVTNKNLKKRFELAYERACLGEGGVLSHTAFEAAYRDGEQWLDSLMEHLYENYNALSVLCAKYSHYIKLMPIEGTYLAWLDCRGMGLRDRALREFFINEAKLGLTPGLSFGRVGSGFMRLNFAISSDTMQDVIQRLDNALKRKQIG